jgi:hypothetical protein
MLRGDPGTAPQHQRRGGKRVFEKTLGRTRIISANPAGRPYLITRVAIFMKLPGTLSFSFLAIFKLIIISA